MNRSPNIEQVIVREAQKKDAGSIARIYNHYVKVGGSTFDNQPWTTGETSVRLSEETPNGWFVAEDELDILGWASVRRYSARFGYRFTCESAIYLDPIAVGCGIGDRLQARIEEHCAQHTIHHAVARIAADNGRSIAFHRRHGYEMVGIQKEIGRINDRWVDVAIMQKVF